MQYLINHFAQLVGHHAHQCMRQCSRTKIHQTRPPTFMYPPVEPQHRFCICSSATAEIHIGRCPHIKQHIRQILRLTTVLQHPNPQIVIFKQVVFFLITTCALNCTFFEHHTWMIEGTSFPRVMDNFIIVTRDCTSTCYLVWTGYKFQKRPACYIQFWIFSRITQLASGIGPLR